jgi:thiol-disulfide isomerase/thioredoxin
MLNAPRIALAAALTATTTLALPAFAQQEPAKVVPGVPLMTKVAPAPAANAAPDVVDAKAKAIHEKGIEAVKKAKSLEAVSEMKVAGVDPAMLPPDLGDKTRIMIDFNGAGPMMPFGRLSVAKMADGKPTDRMATDGKTALMVDEAKKSYMQGGPELMGMMGPRLAMLEWLMQNRMDPAAMHMPEDQVPKMVSCTFVGEEKLDGVDCDVVRAVRSMKLEGMEDDEGKPMPAKEMRMTETIAFARTDALPRRIVSSTEIPGEDMAGMSLTLTLSGVKADGPMDEKAFATAAPEGYKKAEMPSAEEGPGPELKVKAGDAAPDFKLMDLAGKEVTLASLKGKVVLLDFWATWCGPCKAAMPSIQKIHDDYKDKGVAVLGVNTWEKKEDGAKKYMESKGFNYGCLLKGDDLATAYGVTGIPTLVVIGKDGKVALVEVGMGPNGADGLRKAIDAALAAK